jgi:gliding motility-associated-like protein
VKSGGLSGNYVGISASDGDAGPAQRTDLAMRLTGFLFNTIVTERDGNLLDSICFGEVPRPMKASVPVGGTLPYTYFWEKGYTESGPWVPLSGTEAGGVFTPDQPETNTLWIRRTIEDSSIPVIVDNSKKVKVIVHPLITSFEIGHDTGDTICFNQDPTVIEPLVPLPGGGNGFYIYKWHNSPDGLSYNQTLLSGMSTYDPAALANTTWYRRTVYSGACVDSTSFVKITVLPSIGSNIVGPSDVICEGELFTDLSGPPVTGGDGVYTYKWEASDNNSTWGYTIEGTTDQPTYNPDENSTDFPSLSPKYFRRVVYSGEDDCCIAISPSVSLTMQPAITNNGLSESFQTVCEKDPVVNEVIGTTPLGGNGIYTYMWQESVSAGPWTDLADSTRKDFSPYSLSLSTTYRRVVYSGVCEDTSTDEFIIVVQPILEGNSIKTTNGAIDTIICFNQDPPLLTSLDMSGGLGAGTYFYLWEDSSSSHDWQPAPLTNSSKNYDPGNLTQSTWYRRIVSSGTCDSISLPFRITVLPLITGNSISASQDICFGTSPDLLTGTSLGQGLGGGDGTTYTFQWQWDTDPGFSSPVDVGTDNPDYQPGNLDVPTYYRRVVTSGLNGCCEDFSNSVDIAINPLPIGVITAGQDESICEDENISLSLTVTAGLAPFNVVLDDGISDLPLMVSSTGPINHSITPNYVSDQSLTYTLVSIADANGCLATAPNMTGNKTVAFWENPVSNAGLDDEWCLANSNTLDATASIGVGTWSWAGASSVFDQINNPKSAVTYSDFVAGDTVVTFKWKEIRTELPRCTDSASVNIRFFKPPSIALAGDDSTLLPFQVDMVLFANDPVYGTGEWTVLSGGGAMKTGNSNLYNGMVQGLSDGLNLLEWRISNGDVCLDSFDEVELTVPEVKLITGFSPNSDGVNDFFVINGLVEWDGGVVPNELVITDMAGVILYQEKDYGNDWDGRDMRGKPLPSGTYYYFINVFYSTKVQLKGFVIIKRD